jgi:hypothetical protein
MSTIGTKKLHPRAERSSRIAERSTNTPYLLLWATGVAAFVLCVVALVLWGITGTPILFDMIVALCS